MDDQYDAFAYAMDTFALRCIVTFGEDSPDDMFSDLRHSLLGLQDHPIVCVCLPRALDPNKTKCLVLSLVFELSTSVGIQAFTVN